MGGSERINLIDQTGSNKLGLVVSEELKWIYRSQPLYDVGIDAIIEEVKEGRPTGKFIAVQLKSGESHFHFGQDKMTLYVSKVHKNYWMGLNIPIILVGYLPDNKSLVWGEISEVKLKRTTTRWKLDIRANNFLTKKSVHALSKLVRPINSSLFNGFEPNMNNIFNLAENMSLINDSADAVNNINSVMASFTDKNQQRNLELRKFIEKGMSGQDREVQSVYKSLGKDLKLASTRMRNEIEIFAETFGVAISALQRGSEIYHSIDPKGSAFEETRNAIKNMASKILPGVEHLKTQEERVIKIPEFHPILIEGKKEYLVTIRNLINEYESAFKFVAFADSKNGTQ